MRRCRSALCHYVSQHHTPHFIRRVAKERSFAGACIRFLVDFHIRDLWTTKKKKKERKWEKEQRERLGDNPLYMVRASIVTLASVGRCFVKRSSISNQIEPFNSEKWTFDNTTPTSGKVAEKTEERRETKNDRKIKGAPIASDTNKSGTVPVGSTPWHKEPLFWVPPRIIRVVPLHQRAGSVGALRTGLHTDL
ncbi:hypothetical protein GWI33_014142 [Rhynchophorus ferrugineus]|uniref:Uncharacterized protein n=1 Tax=Rhynchophorus ferrugineus TaxID=354439 RepID=A0A834I5M9_RHYFE|nr:hypothetical protein GWI33_014142 [Rhynchophorus ferrugineus]